MNRARSDSRLKTKAVEISEIELNKREYLQFPLPVKVTTYPSMFLNLLHRYQVVSRLSQGCGFSVLSESSSALDVCLGVVHDLVLLSEVNLVCVLTIHTKGSVISKTGPVNDSSKVETDSHLHFVSFESLSEVAGVHSVVHLVAWVEVELEASAHLAVGVAVDSLLHVLSHVLVVIIVSEFLVELLVGRWSKRVGSLGFLLSDQLLAPNNILSKVKSIITYILFSS